MEISILIANMTDDFTSHYLTLQIHQHTQKHVNVQDWHNTVRTWSGIRSSTPAIAVNKIVKPIKCY